MSQLTNQNLAKHSDSLEVLNKDRQSKRKLIIIISVALIAVFLFCLLTGRYSCSRFDVFKALCYGIIDGIIFILELPARLLPFIDYTIANPITVTWDSNVVLVLWTVRMPRILGVIVVGGGLAVSGANYQGVFRNPLVSESILGVSAGASLGAALGILWNSGSVLTSALAFVGGIIAVSLTYSSSRIFKGNPTLLLVLAGTVISSLFSAMLSIVQYLAPPDTKLPEIVFWLMGSFAKIRANDLIFLVPLVLVCCFILYRIRWKLNLLSLGDEEARTLGVNTRQTRLIIIITSTIITAACVCICGMVGWVGVVIPQICRMIVGPDNRKLIPCSFFIGAIFLMIVDVICRAAFEAEIPVGIVTSIVGAPIFLVMLRRLKEGWS